jgi:hypothetical protein
MTLNGQSEKNYLLTAISILFCFSIKAQITVNYPQRVANYDTFFENGGSKYDNGANEFGMWANIGSKESVAWRNFTDDGTPSGNSTTMQVGDSFKISLAAYQAFGQIGVSLLSSPSSKTSWADRINNYAVQVNLNGNGGAYNPWEIVSNDNTVNASTINGSMNGTINEFIFTFTLVSPTKMEVVIERTNNTPITFTQIVTINNSNISGYSLYLADNWDGDSNQDIFWKPTTEYVYANVWDGSTDTNWDTAANWSSNIVPTGTTTNVRIPNLTNQPIATTAVAVNTVYLESGASLIAQDAFTGTITYERNLPTSNWYLVSSPVSGQAYNDAYVTANGIDSGTGSNRGIATYTTSSNQWAYLQAASDGTFNNGQGYLVKRTTTGDISFTGTINTSVSVEVVATDGGEINKGFNLVGNPFTSHIRSNSFLTDNSANLVSQTLWVWDQANTRYDTYVTGDNFILAPTQGFFIRSSNGNNLNIAESYQASTGGTFQKSARTEVKLLMNDGTADRFAKLYYLDNVTKGFDNGFDGETFGGIENSVDVFTNLVENNEGKKYQIQSLPIAEMETMIVPVGIKAAAGKEITFTAEALNLPGDTKVFLEDRLTNTVTRLDEANSSYKITLNDALNETGRFYLHTKASGVLSTDELALSNTSVYATANNTLRVVGLPSGNATVKVFTILGKQVVQTSFSSTGSYDVSLPKLATGMYIVQLETATGKLNKKIVLE